MIKLVSWRMSIRLRPYMYFGKQRTDPGLPGAVLWLAVADALSEEPVEPPLHVRVVIETDRQFRIEDDGPGLPVEPVAEGREPAVAEMLTDLSSVGSRRVEFAWPDHGRVLDGDR